MNQVVSLDQHEKAIQRGKGKGLEGALMIGKALKAIQDGNLYLQVGAKSFDKYVQDHHGFSRSTAYNMIKVFKYFGPPLLADPSLQSVDPTRLVRLLPLITESNKMDLLHMAVTVPDEKGFSNNLRNKKGKTATDDPHEHLWEPIPFEQCKTCGLRRKKEVREGEGD